MRTTILTLLATAFSVHADFTVDYQPTAPAAVTYEASQIANNPAYSAARHAVVQTALANFQTASNSVIRDDVLQTMVPQSQWDVFTSVRAAEVALDKGSAVASATGSASGSGTGSAAGVTGTTTGSGTASASATASANSSPSQSAGAATTSSHSAAAPRATGGLTVGAVVGVMAGLVAAM